jgi:hypothetical protein
LFSENKKTNACGGRLWGARTKPDIFRGWWLEVELLDALEVDGDLTISLFLVVSTAFSPNRNSFDDDLQ